MPPTPVRDALGAHLRNENRRETRMAHMRRVDSWCFLAALAALVLQGVTGWHWLLYVYAGLLAAAWILPKSARFARLRLRRSR